MFGEWPDDNERKVNWAEMEMIAEEKEENGVEAHTSDLLAYPEYNKNSDPNNMVGGRTFEVLGVLGTP